VEIKAKVSRTKETIKPDTLIVMSDNKPIPVDDVLNEGQELTIIQVASGG
jgi:sulfur carrier protein ThiS